MFWPLANNDQIIVDKVIIPVEVPACKLPITLCEKLTDELNRMQRLHIKEPANRPTEFANPLILVEKSNRKLRLCLDLKQLHKALKEQRYKRSTAEKLFCEK